MLNEEAVSYFRWCLLLWTKTDETDVNDMKLYLWRKPWVAVFLPVSLHSVYIIKNQVCSFVSFNGNTPNKFPVESIRVKPNRMSLFQFMRLKVILFCINMNLNKQVEQFASISIYPTKIEFCACQNVPINWIRLEIFVNPTRLSISIIDISLLIHLNPMQVLQTSTFFYAKHLVLHAWLFMHMMRKKPLRCYSQLYGLCCYCHCDRMGASVHLTNSD